MDESRYQVLVLASEMAGPSSIQEIQFFSDDPLSSHAVFRNFNLYMGHTSLSQLTDNYANNYNISAPKLVMSRNVLTLDWAYGQWNGFVFDSLFSYDGTDNLVFESQWQEDSNYTLWASAWYPAGGNRTLDGSSLLSPTGLLMPFMNCLRIYYMPAGIDDNISGDILVNDFKTYPNPFRNVMTISYALTQNSNVKVRIYNVAGELVRSLAEGAQESGNHSVIWDGKNTEGKIVGSGIYLCQLETGNSVLTKKLLSLR